MGELEFSQTAQHWVNVALIWIGFGTLAGLLAKTILPGRNPSGAVGTMVIGIAGSTLGLFVFYRFALGSPDDPLFNPISPIGMLAAAAGALVLLVIYRVLVACVVIDHPPEGQPKEGSKE
jgi:uncharacterized membrane protein YeaQ/YmgE (transglycosylase-associated protein family)